MTRSRFLYGLTIVFLYVTIISSVLTLFFMWRGIYDGPANLIDMVDGTAYRPYICRTLMPSIVHGATVASEGLLTAAGIDKSTSPVSKVGGFFLRRTRAPAEAFEHAHVYAVYSVLAFFCLIGFAVLLRRLIRVTYPDYPAFISEIAPLVGVAVMPLVFFRYVSFVYDPMTLLVFALCAYLITLRSHLLYLLIFPLAVLSKESAILLLPVFHVREMGVTSRAKLIAMDVYQLVVYVVMKLGLTYVFKENPGSFVLYHLEPNLQLLGTLGFYIKTFLPLIPLVVLIAYRWREKPKFLRRALIVMAVPLVVGSMFVGSLGEIRVYYEAYPFAFLLAVPTVVEIFRMRSVAQDGRGLP
jgi:hypothetical protein